MAESVKVIIRCRPFNKRETDLKCDSCVKMDGSTGQVSLTNPQEPKGPLKTFAFDAVYFIESTAEAIYNESVFPLVENVLEGYNGTVFAYGQTGSGKTFSMQGSETVLAQRGIIPRTFEHIFEAIATTENVQFLVHASYLEIYNEEIHDLLAKDLKQKLDVKEHPDKGVYVAGLSLHAVHNVAECDVLMKTGFNNRHVGATLMNKDSSRSHSLFSVHVEMMGTGADGEEHIKTAKLHLVDLAGSERQGKTGATGERLKEATKINLSLSALGNVISALVDGKSKHIPYRDSKLTRLLQDSLGGNTKTIMVACISPADNNYDESLSTLRYANRAKNIKNKPKVNEDPKDALLREYQEEINRLKAMLEGGGGVDSSVVLAVTAATLPVPPTIDLEAERAKLRQEYELQMQELKQQYQHEQKSKAKLQEDLTKLKQDYDKETKRVENTMKRRQSMPAAVDVQQQQQPSIPAGPAGEQSSRSRDDADLPNLAGKPELGGANRKLSNQSVGVAEQPVVVNQEGELVAPSSSPTGQTAPTNLLAHQETIDSQEAAKRLQMLQHQMVVGGEQAKNSVLKEKRLRRKREAEKKMQKLAEALAKVNADDPMLHVYNTVQDKLDAVTSTLEKEAKKVKALESEIQDLQGEFELDRIDYLDTIRRQDRQLKLFQQILDKVQPCLRRDSNYANIERIKKEAVWDEDLQKWHLPEMTLLRTQLPNAGGGGGMVQTGGRIPVQQQNAGPINGYANGFTEERDDEKLKQRLEQSSQENIAGNYFKPNRVSVRLTATVSGATKSRGTKSSSNFPNKRNTWDNLLSGVIYTNDIYEREPATAAAVGSWSNGSSPSVQQSRMPQRLEALASAAGGQPNTMANILSVQAKKIKKNTIRIGGATLASTVKRW